MSSYQVLARKCRPQRFSEIVGQEHITRTLQNAIRQQRVGHAYLFVGSRGIGKTTSARIFAKALNCEAGIVDEPCCKCPSCLEIAAGTSLDVIEIDGASHNKVEHVRDIRDNVQYTPARGRYKIYIIDEVHMLTTQAWNALLKTLEEPPPHVKFFFATTEPHKVLPTIVSRCQRFDLKRLSVKLIAGRLREIADSETIPIDDGALVAIARAADGGMRDAQSIFDQIIAFCGGPDAAVIGETDVINVFGLASGRELASLTAAILGDQADQALAIVDDLADRGRDLERFYGDLVFFVRNVMIHQVCADAGGILDVSQAELEDIAAIGAGASAPLVRRVLEALVDEEGRLKAALNKRVYLEVALVKVMDGIHSVQLEDVIGRLNQIRDREEVTIPSAPKNPPPKIALPERAEPTPAAPATTLPKPKPAPAPTPPPAETKPAPEAAPPAPPTSAAGTTTASDPTIDDNQPERVAPAAEDDADADEDDMLDAPQPYDLPPDLEVADIEVAPTPPPTSPAGNPRPARADATPVDYAKPETLLAELTAHFQELPKNAFLVDCLQTLRAVSYEDGILEVAYPETVAEEQLNELRKRETLAKLTENLRRTTGDEKARILLKSWVAGVSEVDPRTRLVSSPEVKRRVMANPFVQKALDLFGGEIIDVRG